MSPCNVSYLVQCSMSKSLVSSRGQGVLGVVLLELNCTCIQFACLQEFNDQFIVCTCANAFDVLCYFWTWSFLFGFFCVQMELKRGLVDHLIHLLSCGHVIPVISYIHHCMRTELLDQSLIRHFVSEVSGQNG